MVNETPIGFAMPIRRSWTWGLTRYYIGGSGPPKAWSLSPILIVNKTRYRSPQILFRPPLAQGPRGGRGRCQTSFRFIIARTRPAVAHWPPQPLRGSHFRARVSRNRHMFVTSRGVHPGCARIRRREALPRLHPSGRSSPRAQRSCLPERICLIGPEAVLTARGLMESPVNGLKRMDRGERIKARGPLLPCGPISWAAKG